MIRLQAMGQCQWSPRGRGAHGQRAAKTVNVLTTLGVLLKTAVEWGVIGDVPCSIKLLKTPKSAASFYDFDEYERLVEAGGRDSSRMSVAGRLIQRFLLRSRPAFQPTFTFECRSTIVERLEIGQLNRTAPTRESTPLAFVVLRHSSMWVRCLANVEGTVTTAKDVDVVHLTPMPSSTAYWKKKACREEVKVTCRNVNRKEQREKQRKLNRATCRGRRPACVH